ncbi:MAG: hypothetical protein AB7J40_00925 [Candidatus Altimarinota bacterium]
MNPLHVTRYGKGPDEGAINILVPHDASYDQFAFEYPDLLNEMLDAVKVDEETYKKFLTIEQDVFATEAAELLAKNIVGHFQGGIRVQVIKIMIPRGILDMNRIEERALWKTFDHEQHSYLKKRLLSMYRIAYREIKKKIMQAGMVIDLHTMSPTNPRRVIEVNPDNLKDFIKSWDINPDNPRKIDIITSQTIGDETRSLGDKVVIKAVCKALKDHGIEHEQSGTFRLSNIHLGTEWAELAKSYFNIDLTKDWGSKVPVDHEGFDISKLDYDETKLAGLMHVIGGAIAEVINQRLSDPKLLVH